MIYYQHKQTGEAIGSLNNLRDVVTGNGTIQGYSITDVIIPNKVVPNGIICHCMTYSYIRDNYSRISRKKAIDICPDFGQWRHVDDIYNKSVTYLGHIYLKQLEPIRKKPFGTPYTKEGKTRSECYA